MPAEPTFTEFFFKRKEYEIIYRRGEEINFYVLYKCLKNLGFSRLDYYKNFIEIVKPKIILADISNRSLL